MTKKELKSELEEERKQVHLFNRKKLFEMEKHYEDVFGDLVFLPEYTELEVEIVPENRGCSFKAKREGYEYKSEIFTIYFKTSDYTQEDADIIELNYYTTSSSSDEEISRLVLLGAVAKIVQTHRCYEQGGLLQKYNIIQDKYRELIQKSYDKEYDLERQLGNLEKKAEEKRKKKLFTQAFSKQGIKIERGEDVYGNSKSYPDIELRGDRTAYNVSNIRILGYVNPKTKKSVNIEITEIPKQYDYEKRKYYEGEPSTYKVNKVRLDRIEYYITKDN